MADGTLEDEPWRNRWAEVREDLRGHWWWLIPSFVLLVVVMSLGLAAEDKRIRNETECVGRERPSVEAPCAPVRNVGYFGRPDGPG